MDLYAMVYWGWDLFTNGDGRFQGGFTHGVRWYPRANGTFALNGKFAYSPISYATIGAAIKIGK